MTDDVGRDLAGLVFLVSFAVFLLLGYYLARSERITTGSWRPWPVTIGWSLAAIMFAQANAFFWNGVDFWQGSGPFDVMRIMRLVIVMTCALMCWVVWTREGPPRAGS